MEPIKKFLIVDDHSIVRMGVSIIIKELYKNSEIVCAGSFAKAMEQLLSCRFELIILDVNMPGGNRMSMIREIREKDKRVKILMFTALDEVNYAVRYLQSGADGFLNKGTGDEEIRKAISLVLDGKTYMSEIVKEQTILNIVNKADHSNPLAQLSSRESDILKSVLAGRKISQISKDLNLHPTTVSTYKMRLFKKFKVNTLVELFEKNKSLNQ